LRMLGLSASVIWGSIAWWRDGLTITHAYCICIGILEV
jgi:hypothetical protein